MEEVKSKRGGWKLTPEQIERSRIATKKWRDANPITHCKNGHEFTEENTYTNKTGGRVCKACRIIRLHKYRNNLSPERAKEIVETGKKWQERNKDKLLEASKLSRLRRYGLTPESFDIMYNSQGGKCLICKRHSTELGKQLFVDHNHEDSSVRGLLCTNCNSMLGHARDSIEILEEAIEYLRKFKKKELIKDINLN